MVVSFSGVTDWEGTITIHLNNVTIININKNTSASFMLYITKKGHYHEYVYYTIDHPGYGLHALRYGL